MTSPASYPLEESWPGDGPSIPPMDATSCGGDSPPADPSEPLEEIREQLAAWARELESEEADEGPEPRGNAAPDPSDTPPVDTAAEAHIEFLSALAYEELLDVAIALHAERDALFRQLGNLPDLSQLEAMRGRFQTAIEEIEALRARNEHLEAALAGGAADAPSAAETSAGHVGETDEEEAESNWEAQKSLWLNQLQSVEDEPAPPRSVASRADKADAEKQKRLIQQLNKQITELRQQLDERHEIEKLLDADDVVREERKRLEALQQEWETKLRETELVLSRERAEITRARKKLEERETTLEALRERLERQQTGQDKTSNWRDYLGLR